MHGMVNRAIQVFVRDSYGTDAWRRLIRNLDPGFEDFESMLVYPDAVTYDLLQLACTHFQRDCPDFLEDIGTYLISHSNTAALRRLLRFGGDTLPDFIGSLDELSARVRLAVPDLHLPELEVEKIRPGEYGVSVGPGLDGFEHVLIGVLRAMADDYGALVLLDCSTAATGRPLVSVSLLDLTFSEGRDFVLGAQT